MAQEPLRWQVGKPMGATDELLRTIRLKDAWVKVRKVQSMVNENADVGHLSERLRAIAAVGGSDNSHATRTREDGIASVYSGDLDRQKLLRELLVQQFAESQKMLNAGGAVPSTKASSVWTECVDWVLRLRQANHEATKLESGIGRAAQMFRCGAFVVCVGEIQ